MDEMEVIRKSLETSLEMDKAERKTLQYNTSEYGEWRKDVLDENIFNYKVILKKIKNTPSS